MNILYIGPYKQKTVLGLTSQILILNLLNIKNIKLSCVPVFSDFNRVLTDEDINTDIINAEENNNFDQYDCVIQHVPITAAVPVTSVAKNILLPVISASDCELNIGVLKLFDKILVDNQKDYKSLSEHKLLKNKVAVYNYQANFSSKDETKIDLGTMNFYKKLYYVGDYSNNKDNILKLCKSFIVNSQRDKNVLLLFLVYLTKPQKDEIESYINQVHQLCHKNLYPKINVLGIDADIGTLSLAHRTGEVLIDLEDTHSNTLNVKINQIYNKSLLSFSPTDYEIKYENNNTFFPHGCRVVTEGSISNKISHYLHNNTVDNIAHTKKTDINELI